MGTGDEPRLSGARVVVVGINYFPESTGIAPYTTALARTVADAGAQVRVITGVPHYPAWRIDDERYLRGTRWAETIDGIPVLRVRHHVPATADLAGRARMELSFARRSYAALRSTPADAVVAVTPSLSALGAVSFGRRGAPWGAVVQDLTGAGAEQSGTTGRLAGAAIKRAELAALRRADLVGVIASRFGELLVADGVRPERVVELQNFTHITGSTQTRDEARRALGWPVEPLVFLHTGNMGMKQGLEAVVEAGRLAPAGVEFRLTGNGNQRARLEGLAAGVDGVRVLDPVDEDLYPTVLAAADVLVLCERQGVKEMSLPSKLTSYVAARRPIVAAVEPGGITHQLLVKHSAAEIVPAGDSAALLAAATAVASDPARAAELVAAGTAMGESLWSARAAADRYRAFVAALLERR